MRRLKRNQRVFVYQRFAGRIDQVDDNGFKTGRQIEVYEDPVYTKGCVVFKGTSNYKPYGVEEDYSIQIIPDHFIEDINPETKIILFEKSGKSDYLDGWSFIPWEALFNADGGKLAPWTDGYIADGGLLLYPVEYFVKSAPLTMNEQKIYAK